MKLRNITKTNLQNIFNQPFDKFIVYFSNIDDFHSFQVMLEKISDKKWKTDFHSVKYEFPFFVSFSIVPELMKNAFIINIEDFMYYLVDEMFEVNPIIFSSKNIKELSNMLQNIFEEINIQGIDIGFLGLE